MSGAPANDVTVTWMAPGPLAVCTSTDPVQSVLQLPAASTANVP